MKKKIIIIGFVMFFLLISSTMALTPEQDGKIFFKFENNVTDLWGTTSGASNAASYVTIYPTFAVSGDGKTKSAGFDGINDYINTNHTIFYEKNTLSFWMNSTSGTTATLMGNDGAARIEIDINFDGVSGKIRVYTKSGGIIRIKGTFTNAKIINGQWHHIGIVINATAGTFEAYVNAVKQTVTMTDTDTIASSYGLTNPFLLGALESDSHFYKTDIDEFKWYNNTLNLSEIRGINDTGNRSVSAPPAPPSPPPTKILNINATDNETTDAIINFNATLFLGNGSSYYFATTNGTIYTGMNSSDFVYFWNITLRSDSYNDRTYFYYNISNDLMGILQYYDLVPPTLVSDFDGHTINYYDLLTGQFNFSDDVLIHSVNLTIDTNISIFELSGTINSSTYQYNMSYNTENITTGPHILNVRVGDGHTAKLLKSPEAYNPTNGIFNDYMKYNFDYPYKKTYVKIQAKEIDWFDTFTTEYNGEDRFEFVYEPNKLASSYTFKVDSDKHIYIAERKGYYGDRWLIVDEHWLDFYIPEQPDAEVNIVRINDKEVEVTVSNLDPKLEIIEFSSVGDINTVEVNYTFYKGNYTSSINNPILESGIIYAKLNFTKNSSYVSDMTAKVSYNSVWYTATKTTYTNNILFHRNIETSLFSDATNVTNRTIYWNYTITGVNNSVEDNTSTQDSEIYRMIVSNCSNIAVTHSLNISILNEDGGGDITSDMEGLFTVWNRTSSVNRQYGIAIGSKFNPLFCIYPSWAKFQADYILNYDANGYDARSYNKVGGYLNPTVQYLNLYLANSTSTTKITITIVDEFDDPLQGYFVEAWKYILVSNNYTLIDNQETNGEGKAVFNLDTSDQYQFLVKNKIGVVVYTEPKQTLTETSYIFRVRLGAEPESELIKLVALTNSFWIDNNTFKLSWNDIGDLITYGNLTVVKRNVTSEITLNSQQININATTINYSVGNNTGHYVGMFYVTSRSSGKVYLLKTLTHDIKSEFSVFGNETLIAVILFVGTLIGAGLVFGPEVPLILAALGLFVFYLLGFLMISLTALIAFIITLIFVIVKLRGR